MGWIGVDFDGTLAMHPDPERPWPQCGRPIPMMVQRVKNWLAQSVEVRIVSARFGHSPANCLKHTKLVQEWCMEVFGQVLDCRTSKDFEMIELWDDRAVQVVPNTGYRVDGKDDPSEKI